MSQNLILEAVNLSFPTRNYSQSALLEQLGKYIALKKAKLAKRQAQELEGLSPINRDARQKVFNLELENCRLPFDSLDGLCSGLTAYWLYFKRNDEEGKFIHSYEEVLTWDADKFAQTDELVVPKIEEFINNVVLLQQDVFFRFLDVKQSDLDKSFALIKNDHAAGIRKEYSLTLVFDVPTLSMMIRDIARPNNMLRFDNTMHTVGAMLSGGVYYFYNPDSSSGPASFNNANDLASAVFAGLSKYCKSTTDIALNLTVYDLEDVKPVDLPNAVQYCQTLLTNAEYKARVLQHPRLLSNLMRFDEYDIADLVYKHGYTYIQSNLSPTELNEAIIFGNTSKVKYLIQHGFPIDYRSQNGMTPLGKAVQKGQIAILYMLLLAGADPNVPAERNNGLLNFAVHLHNTASLILLLAFGAETSVDELEMMDGNTYTHEQMLEIIKQAILVNQQILDLPNAPFKTKTTDQNILLWLMHEQLKINLQEKLVKSDLKEIAELLQAVEKALNSKAKQHDTTVILEIDALCRNLATLTQNAQTKAKSKLDLLRGKRNLQEQIKATQLKINEYLSQHNLRPTQNTPHFAQLLQQQHLKDQAEAPSYGSIAKYLRLNC